jgi:hypothetical protein
MFQHAPPKMLKLEDGLLIETAHGEEAGGAGGLEEGVPPFLEVAGGVTPTGRYVTVMTRVSGGGGRGGGGEEGAGKTESCWPGTNKHRGQHVRRE